MNKENTGNLNNSNKEYPKDHIFTYYVTENGIINHQFMDCYDELFERKGIAIDGFGMGSAYNMPIYLLGELEENFEKAVVISYYVKDDLLRPIVLFDDMEIKVLMEYLEKAGEDEDSYDILKKVHQDIRG